MNEHRREYAITLMCRVLRVAGAGFYAWLHEPSNDHAKEDARLLDLIRESYTASHGVYGGSRIFGDLREVSQICGLHRVERLMQENGIKSVRGYKGPGPLLVALPSSPRTACSATSPLMCPTRSG
jgi:putative transposase